MTTSEADELRAYIRACEDTHFTTLRVDCPAMKGVLNAARRELARMESERDPLRNSRDGQRTGSTGGAVTAGEISALENAVYASINRFQDMLGWQEGESRNALIVEIRDDACVAVRNHFASKGTPND